MASDGFLIQRGKHEQTYNTIAILVLGYLKCLTTDELVAITQYVKEHYWPKAPTILDISLGWADFLKELLSEG